MVPMPANPLLAMVACTVELGKLLHRRCTRLRCKSRGHVELDGEVEEEKVEEKRVIENWDGKVVS